MAQNTKVAQAIEILFQEIQNELKGEEVESIEVIFPNSKKGFPSIEGGTSKPILEGKCVWDPVKKKVVCKP